MNLEEELLIERYLNDELSELERKDFLARLDKDVEFRKKVSLEKELMASFDEKGWSVVTDPKSAILKTYKEVYRSDEIQHLDKELEKINKQYQAPKKTNIGRLMLFASAAAVTLFLLVNTFFTTFTSEELYFKTLDVSSLPSFVSREDANENELVKAQLLFEEKDYERAATIFEKELKNAQNRQNASVYVYLGVAQMQLSEFENAERTFNTLISRDLLDAEKGLWYKALLYLKMERIDACKTLLEKIVETQAYNSEKASALLQKLSKIKTS